MEQNEPLGKTEALAKEIVDYVNMRVDAFKLNVVENLSSFFSSAIALMLFVIFGTMALLMFTAAFTYWLGIVIGSMFLSILIVGFGFLALAFILFALGHRLIADRMVRMFSQMFFNSGNTSGDDK